MEDVNLPHAAAGVVVNEDSGQAVQSLATKEHYRWMDDTTRTINDLLAKCESINESIVLIQQRLTAGGL